MKLMMKTASEKKIVICNHTLVSVFLINCVDWELFGKHKVQANTELRELPGLSQRP